MVTVNRQKIRGLDTEATGLDMRFGARPFLVTFSDEEGQNTWWEWPVDPLTRKVQAKKEDLVEIQRLIDDTDVLVLQNAKFDQLGLQLLFADYGMRLRWDWNKVQDTLYAAHLLASNQPHDLTTLAMVYCRLNILPLETAMKDAVKEARRWAMSCRAAPRVRKNQKVKVKYKGPIWRLAKKGLPEMPSAKEKVGDYDYWLPRAVVYDCLNRLEFSALPNHPRLPTVGRVNRCTVRIDRKTKWGNPFFIGRDGDRQEVIAKYVKYILESDLLADLPELYGEALGCHCYPKLCHGHVLRALCHPWWTVCSEYANGDSTVVVPVLEAQRELIAERGLTAIYNKRLELLSVASRIENRGVTISASRLQELQTNFSYESQEANDLCCGIARAYDYELTLPKGGTNKSLSNFVFGTLGLHSPKQTQSGAQSMDKTVLEEWEATLPAKSKPQLFVKTLRGKRLRDTSLTYMQGYKRFWLPLSIYNKKGEQLWYQLHPSLNATGTDTLRWSSSNPNEQNISKKEEVSLRYLFGPAPGREWWSLDYENLELRIPGYESGEQKMIELFEQPDEPPYFGSYHLLNASIVFPKLFWPLAEQKGEFKKRYKDSYYQWTKNGGFAKQYGAQQPKVDATFHRDGAYKLLATAMPRMEALNQQMIAFAGKNGYVETIPDRTVCPERGYPILCSRTKWGGVKPTVPLNYHVQSTAMWCTMKAMLRCQTLLDRWNADLGIDPFAVMVGELEPRGYYIVMQIHDEMVFDLPYKKNCGNLSRVKQLRCLMEKSGTDINIPLRVSIEYHPNNWQDSEGLRI